MQWVKSESTERPLEFDEQISRTGVYIRRNIAETQREGLNGGQTIYTYDELYIPNNEKGILMPVLDIKNDVEEIKEGLLAVQEQFLDSATASIAEDYNITQGV